MLINGAGCKITATGQSHPRPPKAAKLSPDEVIRRPNAPYQSWVRLHIAHIGTVNFTVSWDLWQTEAPICFKISSKYVHRIYPHFSIRQQPCTRRVAGMIATAAFLAPLMVMVPSNG